MTTFGNKALKIFDVIILVITVYFLYLLYSLFIVDAWFNRSEFFNGGIHSPSLIDMIINELIFSLVLILILVGKFRWMYAVFVALAALVYFTRAGIILFVLACVITPAFTGKTKIKIVVLGFFASLLILVIRFSGEFPKAVDLLMFYIDYPFVGLGRLLETRIDRGINHFTSLTLFFRPVGVIPFSYDYLMGLDGVASIERHAAKSLSEFEYIPLLDGDFNAFGTIFYPYLLAYGLHFGSVAFFISIVIFYSGLRLIFNKAIVLRICSFLCISGFLFSWISPFIWLAPFILGILGVVS